MSIIALIGTLPEQWIYVFIFALAFLEGLPAAGLFIPGQTAIVLIVFVSQQIGDDFIPVLLVAIIGAFIGDAVAYWLGRRYGATLFRKQHGVIRKVQILLQNHPSKTLVIGRFNSITRAFAPFSAGASLISRKKFLLANALGSILWGTTWITIGYVAGASYSALSHWISIAALVAGAVVAISVISYRYLHKQSRATRQTTSLLALTIISLSSFLLIAAQFRSVFVSVIDTAVNNYIPHIRIEWLTTIMVGITSLVDPVIVTILSFALIVSLVNNHRVGKAVIVGFTLITGVLLSETLKNVILRSRPPNGIIEVTGYSFPSGHAMMAIILFGSFVLSLGNERVWRGWWGWAGASIVLLVGFSRIYLGVHYLSDVLAGFFSGACWLGFTFLCYQAYNLYNENRKQRIYKIK